MARFDCPILAIYGDKDVQVDAEMNRRAFEKAVARAGRKRAKAVVIVGANHLFQPNAKTGSVSEYALLPKQFVPGVLEAIDGFISDVTR